MLEKCEVEIDLADENPSTLFKPLHRKCEAENNLAAENPGTLIEPMHENGNADFHLVDKRILPQPKPTWKSLPSLPVNVIGMARRGKLPI